MTKVVVPAKSSEVPAMTVPATVAEVKAARKAKVEQEQFDGSRKLTAEEWKAIQKADRKRQQAWQDEYRQKAEALRAMEVAG